MVLTTKLGVETGDPRWSVQIRINATTDVKKRFENMRSETKRMRRSSCGLHRGGTNEVRVVVMGRVLCGHVRGKKVQVRDIKGSELLWIRRSRMSAKCGVEDDGFLWGSIVTHVDRSTHSCEDLEAWARVSGIAHQDDSVIRPWNGVIGDRHRDVPIGEFETLSERMFDVQTSVLGEEDCSVGVRDVDWFLVESPFDVVGFPDAPHGVRIWVEDLGDPDVPGGKVHRCGEDGRRSGEKESGQSREFHCWRIGGCS